MGKDNSLSNVSECGVYTTATAAAAAAVIVAVVVCEGAHLWS